MWQQRLQRFALPAVRRCRQGTQSSAAPAAIKSFGSANGEKGYRLDKIGKLWYFEN